MNALRRLQSFGVNSVLPSGVLLGPASSLPSAIKPPTREPPVPVTLQLTKPSTPSSNSSGDPDRPQTPQPPAAPQLTTAQLQQQALAQAPLHTDCCICLFPVTVCQALFVAPCSHAFHYKCMRPMLLAHHPGLLLPALQVLL